METKHNKKQIITVNVPATIPEAMVARRGVFVRAFILDRVRNSSPSSAMA